MTIAHQELRIIDPGLGVTEPATSIALIIGHASAGTLLELQTFGALPDLLAEYPQGQLAETAAHILSVGGGPVRVLRMNTSVAASNSAVTADRAGSSTGTVTVAGTAADNYGASVTIVTDGKLGVGEFTYSLDDGVTQSSVLLLPLGGTYAPPNSGLTLTFTGTPTNGAVTQTGSGPAVTLTGTPSADHDFEIEMTLGGAVATATFQWRVDGGAWTTGVVTAATVLLTGGVTANFAVGTYVDGTTYTWSSTTTVDTDFDAGDVHSFTTVAAMWNATDLAEAMEVIKDADESLNWDFLVCAGKHASCSAAATITAALDVHLTDLENEFQFVGAMIDGGNGTYSEWLSAFSAVASRRISSWFGDAQTASAKSFAGWSNPMLPDLVTAAARAARSLISTDLGRVADEALPGVTAITHNEGKTQTLDNGRASTLCTVRGRPGFYVGNARLLSSPGSDFKFWQHRRIMDVACRTVVQAQSRYYNEFVRTNADGTIDERDALAIEADVESQLRAQLTTPQNVKGQRGHVSALSYRVDRTNNVLTTGEIISHTAIRPHGYIKKLTASLGFQAQVAPATA
jgi:hypothetical protein